MSSFVCDNKMKTLPGHTFNDVLIKVYALANKVIKVGDGEDEYTITKEPVVVDEFRMSKKIQAEAEGQSLKDIIDKVNRTGDISLLDQRKGIYTDITGLPQNTAEAMQYAVDTEGTVSNLSKEELDLIASCKGKTPSEIAAIVAAFYQNKQEIENKNEKGEGLNE